MPSDNPPASGASVQCAERIRDGKQEIWEPGKGWREIPRRSVQRDIEKLGLISGGRCASPVRSREDREIEASLDREDAYWRKQADLERHGRCPRHVHEVRGRCAECIDDREGDR